MFSTTNDHISYQMPNAKRIQRTNTHKIQLAKVCTGHLEDFAKKLVLITKQNHQPFTR